MDGITDAPFRWITDIYGKPDIIYTEFVSVKGLILGKLNFLVVSRNIFIGRLKLL